MLSRSSVACAVLLAAALAPTSSAATERTACKHGARAFARTDLFFGRTRPGGVVTEAQFKAFVDGQVTPRFPGGLTLLTGIGQFRDASGATLVEGANVLILLYPHGDARADRQIDAIRSDYRQRFEQQSVLRADSVSCVSF